MPIRKKPTSSPHPTPPHTTLCPAGAHMYAMHTAGALPRPAVQCTYTLQRKGLHSTAQGIQHIARLLMTIPVMPVVREAKLCPAGLQEELKAPTLPSRLPAANQCCLPLHAF